MPELKNVLTCPLIEHWLLFFYHRTDHHSWWREHPSCAHRGRTEGRGAHHQQRHAHRRQAQIPLYAAHSQSKQAPFHAQRSQQLNI